jgi:DNA-binding NarL/FixJ family response regulator
MSTTLLAPPARAATPVRGPISRRLARRPGLAARPAQTAPDRTARILIVDDDAMARSWLRLSLRESEFRIAMEAATAGEAIALLSRLPFDVVLVDHRLPDSSGTELARELRRRGIVDAAVVLTSTGGEPGFNEAARVSGAQGTLVKTGSPSELLETLRAALDGAYAFDARHPARQTRSAALSAREREVLTLVAEGATNGEIARSLGVGIETVKTLLRRTFLKLGVHRRVQAVWAARELGLV